MNPFPKEVGNDLATTSSWQRLVATIDEAGNDLATTSSWQRLVATIDKAVGNDLASIWAAGSWQRFGIDLGSWRIGMLLGKQGQMTVDTISRALVGLMERSVGW